MYDVCLLFKDVIKILPAGASMALVAVGGHQQQSQVGSGRGRSSMAVTGHLLREEIASGRHGSVEVGGDRQWLSQDSSGGRGSPPSKI